MKKMMISLLLLMGLFSASGQVLLNLQLPPSGIYLKSQLWNFSVINTSGQPISIKIEMTFSDAANGQRIMTASSGIVLLTQQVTQLQSANLTPIVYSIINNAYNIDTNPNGFLPAGRFDVCFAVMQVNLDVTDKLTEECETIEVEPASPPILVEPADGNQSDITRPFFTWVPPAPVSSFNNLLYDWVLVEVQGNQTPADAIQQNLPVYAQQNLAVNSLPYPSSLPELGTDKTYAWQVAAKSSNNAVAKSDIWTFVIKQYAPDTLQNKVGKGYYVPLKRENDAAYSTSTGMVRYEYLNEINDTAAKISICEITGTERTRINLEADTVKLRYGYNYLITDLMNNSGIKNKHIYLLELINSKQERWYLKFEYRAPATN
jgi:hypothetical protein